MKINKKARYSGLFYFGDVVSILKFILKTIVWIALSIPLLAILWMPYYLSLSDSALSIKSVEATLGYLSDKSCGNMGLNTDLINCIFDKNKTIVLIGSAFCFSLLVAVLMYRHLIKYKVFKYISDNFLFIILVVPIFYYVYIYLPNSWRANNPLGFIILAASVFIHLFSVSLLGRIFIKIFKKDLTTNQ